MKKRTPKKKSDAKAQDDTAQASEQSGQTTGDDFLVVGLGASAGGIRAFKEFFAHVPPDSGMAYVVILHLSPEHESHLAEVLQVSTEMPVEEVRDAVKIEPNHVYVIPPNKSLAMNDGRLALSEIRRIEERRAPVDIFFRTLADSKHTRAVSVVLSGTGADGSMGMKRVKEMGGICVVQDPREAEYPDMPRHSIETGLVDYVLPVAEIPQKLVAYNERLGQMRVPLEVMETPETDERALRQIFTQLRVRTGHDFSNYKRPTVLRRIERRINVNELADLQAYAHFMREHPDEAQALLKDLLISVTNFFRDSEAFETLERGFIRRLFENNGAGDQLRVWVAGCATGEEAYTVAMMLCEFAQSLPSAPTVQVFATDIDEQAVATAREGFYTEADVADISPERLRRFFIRETGGYRVSRELREMILFAQHNLIKDPPFSHLDMISCRNLLIYLNRTAQERVMQVFHFALNPGGFLFLGTSESVDGSTELFLNVDKDAHVYQSRATTAARLPLPILDQSPAERVADIRRKEERGQEPQVLKRLSYADLHQRLVEQYMPPSVVVNEEYDIVHLSERAGRFMQVAGGEPSHNLLKMVRSEIRTELRTALYQAMQKRVSVEARNIPVRLEEGLRLVNLQVRPVFSEGDNARGFILVIFDDAGKETESASAEEMIIAAEPAVQQLDDELVRVKAQLRATIEQYETQTEELKASNEELQAMNEELRSTAEELETSKEELQSVNEELTTVNQELKITIEDLSQANDDFRNLMNSTDIGTVFLDRSLRLKLFTPRARDIFNLIPADVGRPLSDITAHLNTPDLLADLEHVLASLQPVQREVETREGRWYLMNALPYRTLEDRIEGVVLTFPDITERKLTEKDRFFLASIVESSEDAIITVDFGGSITSWNKAAEGLYGYTAAEAIGKPLTMLTLPEDLKEVLKNADKVKHSETVELYDTIRIHKGGRQMNLELMLSPIKDSKGQVIGVSTIARNVTERRRAETLLEASQERMHLLIASVTDYAIIIQDMNGRIEIWNPGAERMFGFTAAEAVGQSIEIIFTPEDRARGAHLEEMKTARERGRAADERWHVRKDGSRFYVSGVLTFLRDGDLTGTGYAKIARDLTESRQAQEALRRAHEELELRVAERTHELAETNKALHVENAERRRIERARLQLLRQLVRVQDDERRRIARDIHDHLGQQSTALRLKLESIKEQCLEYEHLCEPFEQTQAIAARLDADVDFLAWELRPAALDDLGLASALANFVKEWSKHFGIPAEFHTTGMDKNRPSPEIETNLYRIAQEALNNTYKHARASRVDVLLERRDTHVVLIIEDNGDGFDLKDKAGTDRGLGLLGMRERAGLIGGTLEIEATPGGGTTIFARVPISLPEEGDFEG